MSRVSPSTPSCMKRSCQRQTTVLPLPTARVMAVVPAPSAVRTMIRDAPNVLLRAVAIPDDRLQASSIRRRDFDDYSLAHAVQSHSQRPRKTLIRTLPLGEIH